MRDTHHAETDLPDGRPVPAPRPPREEGGLLALQRAAGNQAVGTLMRQAAPGAQVSPAPAPGASTEVADDFEGEAMAYFEDHMRAELMAAAGAEGVAIGRRASVAAGNRIRQTCEPYEADLELDTTVLNTVFALTGGGASVAEGLSSGPKPGTPMGSGAVNLSSRAFRAAQGLVQVWVPRLAGYRTVGSLKEAALREASEAANQAGEGGSASFAAYEAAALDALHADWVADVAAMKQTIVRNDLPAAGVGLVTHMLSTKRPEYMTRLRTRYGAASETGSTVEAQIVNLLQPRLDLLREHLDAAKAHREHVQQGAAIRGGGAGGAAVGAGIGAFFGGVGAVPGALIGGAVGLVGGLVGAAVIGWD